MNADANDPSDDSVVDSGHTQADAMDALTDEQRDEQTDAAYADLDEDPDLTDMTDLTDLTDITDTTEKAGDVDDPMDAGEAAAEVPFEPVDLTPDAPVPGPPITGDAAIDESMVELAEAQTGSNAERIDAGERAHRMLQGRLADLGGA